MGVKVGALGVKGFTLGVKVLPELSFRLDLNGAAPEANEVLAGAGGKVWNWLAEPEGVKLGALVDGLKTFFDHLRVDLGASAGLVACVRISDSCSLSGTLVVSSPYCW